MKKSVKVTSIRNTGKANLIGHKSAKLFTSLSIQPQRPTHFICIGKGLGTLEHLLVSVKINCIFGYSDYQIYVRERGQKWNNVCGSLLSKVTHSNCPLRLKWRPALLPFSFHHNYIFDDFYCTVSLNFQNFHLIFLPFQEHLRVKVTSLVLHFFPSFFIFV